MKIDIDEPSHIIQLFARKVHQAVLVFRSKKTGWACRSRRMRERGVDRATERMEARAFAGQC